MKPINRLLTALSLTTVVITIERVSPTTRVLLQPDRFLHLHEVLQIGLITAFSTIISFLIFRTVSGNFRELAGPRGLVLACLFILGLYLYASGNAGHEIASFLFNTYCNTKHFSSHSCQSVYLDDYFFGNGVYFVGLGLSTVAVILLEVRAPNEEMSTKDSYVTIANGLVLALTFIAYDGFDRVAVGLVASIVFAVLYVGILLRSGRPFRFKPFTLYSALGFSIASVVAIPTRILHS